MFRLLQVSLVVLVACAALLNTAPAPAGDNAANALVGKPAPDFQGDFALNGKPVKLSDLKGKVVLVDFWAVWCGPCLATFPHLREWHKEYKDQGLEILGVTMYNFDFGRKIGFDKDSGRLKAIPTANKETEQEMLKDFAAHHKLEHRLMTMPGAEVKQTFKDYGVRGIPQVVLIDRKGIVRMVRVGSGEANAKALAEEIKKLVAEK